jgi:hypothetical protein
MEFRIYLRKFGKLLRLYKLSRTTRGFYFFYGSKGENDYVTYHEDGKYWIRRYDGQKAVKRLRQPLSSFSGTVTLVCSFITVNGPTVDALEENEVLLRQEDIIVEREGSFGIEVILTENHIQLPNLLERPNSFVYVKGQFQPIIIVEVYDLVGNIIQPPRYASEFEWVDGENSFYNHHGHI